METTKSRRWFRSARARIPGGVNSPVRAFRAVGGDPRFIASAKGSRLVDVDGNRYVDYVMSWGPLILGHAPPPVVRAVSRVVRKGASYGAPHSGEVEIAELLCSAIPSMAKVRLVSSGTEACMSAVRAARAFTGRDGVVKFEGAYHGHADGMLVRAGSGAATFGAPDSPGVPADVAAHTMVLPYNDAGRLRTLIRARGRKIACVIVEPVAGNMGVVPPSPGFLEELRARTARAGIVLIFDEVITGFRVAWGGAQALFGIRPDLTTLGKIVGGGLPIGAYGGRREIMDLVSPEGPVYQAGTLSGNPLAVAAGLAQLRELKRRPGLYRAIARVAERLAAGLERLGLTVNRVGSMLTPFFAPGPVRNWEEADRADRKKYARFFHGMLERGVYLPPSQFEAWFVSAAHIGGDVDRTLRAAREVMREPGLV